MYHGNERPFVEILQNGGWSAVVSIEKAASCVYDCEQGETYKILAAVSPLLIDSEELEPSFRLPFSTLFHITS